MGQTIGVWHRIAPKNCSLACNPSDIRFLTWVDTVSTWVIEVMCFGSVRGHCENTSYGERVLSKKKGVVLNHLWFKRRSRTLKGSRFGYHFQNLFLRF